MSIAIQPETLDLMRRYVRTEDAKNAHQKAYPEWWADGTGSCGDGSEADETWGVICLNSVGPSEILEAVREVIGVASTRCLVHEDCLGSPELGVACAGSEIRGTERKDGNG